MSAAPKLRKIAWAPQDGPQTLLVRCPVEDVLFGGARGGGKSDGLLGDFAIHAGRHGAGANGILFRRSLPELEQLVSRALTIYGALGAQYEVVPKRWTFPGGGALRMQFLDRDDDALKYQGHEYTWEGFDELGNFPSPKPFDLLWGSLRSSRGVPCYRRSTANPGGPGHVWVKRRYIDPGPYRVVERRPLADRPDLVIRSCFIPSRLEDNVILQQHDPHYEARLAAVGGPKLFRAWRHGDWSAIEGQYFDCFSKALMVKPHAALSLAPWHPRWIAIDWGWEHPAAIGLFAHNGNYNLTRAWTAKHTEIEAIARQIATDIVVHKEKTDQYDAVYLSPDAFAQKQDENTLAIRLGRELRKYGLPQPTRAVTDRVNGWRACYGFMRNGQMFFSDECKDELWDVLEAAIHDPDHPEDLLKFDATEETAGDDLLDMLRYGIMTRVHQPEVPVEEKIREMVSDKIEDPVTGETTLVMPTDPNVLAMRARVAELKVRREKRGIRPRARGW